MVRVFRAQKETRSRDRKRNRFVLKVGTRAFHVTPQELQSLVKDATECLTPRGGYYNHFLD